jgi:serine/threonine protein kinase
MCVFDRRPAFNGLATDVWALGAAFYIMLTGRAPFRDGESSNTTGVAHDGVCVNAYLCATMIMVVGDDADIFRWYQTAQQDPLSGGGAVPAGGVGGRSFGDIRVYIPGPGGNMVNRRLVSTSLLKLEFPMLSHPRILLNIERPIRIVPSSNHLNREISYRPRRWIYYAACCIPTTGSASLSMR